MKNKIWFWSGQIQILTIPQYLLRPVRLQISRLPKIVQNWFCIQNLRVDLSFQEEKTVCKSVTWFKSNNNLQDAGEFRWVLTKSPKSGICPYQPPCVLYQCPLSPFPYLNTDHAFDVFFPNKCFNSILMRISAISIMEDPGIPVSYRVRTNLHVPKVQTLG